MSLLSHSLELGSMVITHWDIARSATCLIVSKFPKISTEAVSGLTVCDSVFGWTPFFKETINLHVSDCY